jgi:DNA-binding response OmpR family regulator
MKVLIVEDESLIAYQYRAILISEGHSIAGICATGEDAIEQTIHTQPDVIVMDHRLKGKLSGLDAGFAIRKRVSTPIVFITAFSELVDSSTKASMENSLFLDKPVSPGTLINVMKELKPVISLPSY